MSDITYDYGTQTNGSNGRGARDVIEFPANMPVQLALKYAKPKAIQTRRGLRYMLTTSTPRNMVAFLDAEPALKLEHLGVRPGDLFWICYKNTGDLGEWDLWLDPSTEKARSQEPPAPPPPPRSQPPTAPIALDHPEDSGKKAGAAEAPANQSIRSDAPSVSQIHVKWAEHLTGVTNALVGAYAAALAYAGEHYGNQVKPEDVRSLLVTAFIQQCSKGSHR